MGVWSLPEGNNVNSGAKPKKPESLIFAGLKIVGLVAGVIVCSLAMVVFLWIDAFDLFAKLQASNGDLSFLVPSERTIIDLAIIGGWAYLLYLRDTIESGATKLEKRVTDRFDVRFNELRAAVEQLASEQHEEFRSFRKKFGPRLEAIGERFDALASYLEKTEKSVTKRFEEIERRLERLADILPGEE
jgi:hypothetical protein